MGKSKHSDPSAGFTLVELVLALTLGALVMLAVATLMTQTLRSRAYASEKNALAENAHFAMQRMVRAVSRTRLLLVPTVDRPSSGSLSENIREETVPRTGLATAALAVTLDATVDRDGNNKPDADNDGDGRIDEDWPDDNNNDSGMGVKDIDDDGDGSNINLYPPDDDEDSPLLPKKDEDPINLRDDDGDGLVDEDAGVDMNGDGFSGIKGVDDDGDGSMDEGAAADDDEDGATNEDWQDTVIFRLSGSTLVERTPVPWDTDGNATVNGRDYVENTVANHVTRFRVERVAGSSLRSPLIDLTLELTGPGGETVSLNTRVRAGAAQ